MSQQSRTRRRLATLATLALALLSGACKDTAAGLDDHEPEVASMRITVTGGSSVTVNSAGVVTGTLSIQGGAARAITVEFLNAAGQPDSHVDAATFQASVTPAAGLTFTRTGPFAGTLLGMSAGVVNVQFGLLHVAENHNDFGPFTVPVTIVVP